MVESGYTMCILKSSKALEIDCSDIILTCISHPFMFSVMLPHSGTNAPRYKDTNSPPQGFRPQNKMRLENHSRDILSRAK